jgi:endogenous inhibitor of DNA gyrase (YacG/DUF329 family)
VTLANKWRVACPVCDRTVDRQSRQQKFCSTRCRMKAWRKETPAGELKNEPRYPCSGSVTNPHKSSNENNILQWPKSGSSISCKGPINLLGGGSWKWPDAGQLDSETLAKIRWCEVGGELIEPPE